MIKVMMSKLNSKFILDGPSKETREIPFAYHDEWNRGKKPTAPASPLSYLYLLRIGSELDQTVKEWFSQEIKHRQGLLDSQTEGSFFLEFPRLYDFQNVGVSFLIKNKRSLLTDAPRLGKTVQSLVAMQELAQGDTIYIFALKSLLDQWAEHVEEWTDYEPVILRANDKSPRLQVFNSITRKSKNLAVIMNWEFLRNANLRIHRIRNLIGDEIHVVRNRKSLVGKAFARMRPTNAILMTATPVERNAADYFNYIRVLRPTEFKGYWEFVAWYCETRFNGFGNGIVGNKNEKLLLNHLASFSFGRRIEDVADVPEKQFSNLVVKPTPQLLKQYKILEKEILIDLPDTDNLLIIDNALVRMLRLRQISITPKALGFKFPSPKIPTIVDYVKRIGDEQFIIFCTFRSAIAEISVALEREGYTHDVFVGGSARPLNFLSGVSQGLVTSPQVGGVGLDFSCASIIIYADLPLSATLLRQSMERTTAIGIKKPRRIVSCVCTPIDKAIARALKAKQNNIEAIDIYKAVLQ